MNLDKYLKTIENDLLVPLYFYGPIVVNLINKKPNNSNILYAYVKENNLDKLRKKINQKKYKIIIDSLPLTGKDYGLTITDNKFIITIFPIKEVEKGLIISNYCYNEKNFDIRVSTMLFTNIKYNEILKKININNKIIHYVSLDFIYLLKYNSKKQAEREYINNLKQLVDIYEFRNIKEKTKYSKIIENIGTLNLNFISDKQLYHYIINNFDYGAKYIINNRKLLLPIDKKANDNKHYNLNLVKKIGFPIKKIDIKNTYLQSIKEMSINNPIGTSIDRVEFAAFYLEKLGYEVKRYALIEKNNNKVNLDHTFLAYKKNNKWYSFETTLKDFEGIKEFNNLNSLEQLVGAKLFLWKAKFKIDSAKFNVDNHKLIEYTKLKGNISYQEIVESIKKGTEKNTDIAKKCFKKRQDKLLKKCKSVKDINKLLKKLNEKSPISKKFIILIITMLTISITIGVISAFILNN